MNCPWIATSSFTISLAPSLTVSTDPAMMTMMKEISTNQPIWHQSRCFLCETVLAFMARPRAFWAVNLPNDVFWGDGPSATTDPLAPRGTAGHG